MIESSLSMLPAFGLVLADCDNGLVVAVPAAENGTGPIRFGATLAVGIIPCRDGEGEVPRTLRGVPIMAAGSSRAAIVATAASLPAMAWESAKCASEKDIV